MINGICISDVELNLSLFADDTTVILDGSQLSLSTTMKEIEMFGNITGLKINIDKTQLTWIGSKKYSSDKMCLEYNLVWGNTKFCLLDLHLIIKLNFDKKIC